MARTERAPFACSRTFVAASTTRVLAIDTGVDGVDVLIATSSRLRPVSHGMSIDEIIEIGTEVVGEIRGAGLEARFSTEDSFR